MTNSMKYHFDTEKGIIYDEVTGDRCFIITKARLLQIIERLKTLFQTGAQVIIAEAFKAAGERYASEVPEAARANQVLFLTTAVQRFTGAGLGKIEIVKLNPESLELTFRIWNNFFAEMHDGESTYCDCVAAFTSGMYKRITQKTPEIEDQMHRKRRCVLRMAHKTRKMTTKEKPSLSKLTFRLYRLSNYLNIPNA